MAETQAEGEAGSMREPDVGLDPRTPGSRPGPKAALNRWATQAGPVKTFLSVAILVCMYVYPTLINKDTMILFLQIIILKNCQQGDIMMQLNED